MIYNFFFVDEYSIRTRGTRQRKREKIRVILRQRKKKCREVTDGYLVSSRVFKLMIVIYGWINRIIKETREIHIPLAQFTFRFAIFNFPVVKPGDTKTFLPPSIPLNQSHETENARIVKISNLKPTYELYSIGWPVNHRNLVEAGNTSLIPRKHV